MNDVSHTPGGSDDSAAPAGGRNPFVFAVGCPRSGTTLLQRMLDAHPQLAVAKDTHFIPKIVGQLSSEPNPPLTPEIVEAVRGYRRFYRMGLSDEAVDRAAASAGTFVEFVGALYGEFGRERGKALAGEKTPDYVCSLPLLHELFPWARSVHIIRDGRDVALSVLEWAHPEKGPGKMPLWNDEPIAVCALWWRRNVERGLRDGANLGAARSCRVLYEDLVAQTEETLRELVAFLGLPYSETMAGFHRGKTNSDPALSAKDAWLPATSGLRDWRAQMAARDVELFEALAGDVLDELGYERGADSISGPVADVADRCLAWFQGWRSGRMKTIPGIKSHT